MHELQQFSLWPKDLIPDLNAPFLPENKTSPKKNEFYAHQPFCRRVLLNNYHFIFACKPLSHTHLYGWIDLLDPDEDIRTQTQRIRNAKGKWETHTLRYVNDVPLKEGEGSLRVNWIEHTIVQGKKQTYKNAFITDRKITEKNAMGLAEGGRSRWKIENENNNTLKTKGYHLEHNFGHGKENLCSVLATLNILAFLMHTFLDFNDRDYRAIRLELRSRKKFFEHVRVLASYHAYSDWEDLMRFMMRGLEIAYDSG